MLLALDTSTRFAGIALYEREKGIISEANWHAGGRHTVALLPRVSQMMEEQGAAAADFEAIAVALGPGSFTGLRVGLAAAKGLALAVGVPLIGIPTLDVTAYPHRWQPLPVVAIVQAGRGRVCWARYGSPSEESGDRMYVLSDVAGMAAAVKGPALFVGELSPANRTELGKVLSDGSVLAPPALAIRRAGYLAEMGWSRFADGLHDDTASLNAIYPQEIGAAAPARSAI
jgi:tRNA threonylcarbamoyladenosine biosynthesis protein TsaB